MWAVHNINLMKFLEQHNTDNIQKKTVDDSLMN